MGRPSSYTPEIADAICDRIADGESLRKICTTANMPGRRTVLEWMERDEGFRAKCARARDAQADVMLDQQLEVAQGVLDGDIDPQAGKVAISTYQWIGAKLAPKKYGERIDQYIQGGDGGPVGHKVVVEMVPSPSKANTPGVSGSFAPNEESNLVAGFPAKHFCEASKYTST